MNGTEVKPKHPIPEYCVTLNLLSPYTWGQFIDLWAMKFDLVARRSIKSWSLI